MIWYQVAVGILLLINAVYGQAKLREGDWFAQRVYGERFDCGSLHLTRTNKEDFKFLQTFYISNTPLTRVGTFVRENPSKTYRVLNPDGTPRNQQVTVPRSDNNILVIQNIANRENVEFSVCFTRNRNPTKPQQKALRRFCGNERYHEVEQSNC